MIGEHKEMRQFVALVVVALAAQCGQAANGDNVDGWVYDRIASHEVLREREAEAAAAAERAQREKERVAAEEKAARIAAAEAEAAAKAEAAAIVAAEKRAAFLKRKTEAEAHVATLRRSKEAEAAVNEFAVHRDAYKYHVKQTFAIKPKANQSFCLTVPPTSKAPYKNGEDPAGGALSH